jgi:hypothetical protein
MFVIGFIYAADNTQHQCYTTEVMERDHAIKQGTTAFK